MDISFKHKGKISTLVVAVNADLEFDAPHMPKDVVPFVQHVIRDRQDAFQGKVGQSLLVVNAPSAEVDRVLLIGTADEGRELGRAHYFSLLGGYAGRALSANKITQATIGWHSFMSACQIQESERLPRAAHFAQGLLLSNYRFQKYMTQNLEKSAVAVEKITYVDTDEMRSSMWSSMQHIVDGVALARDAVNEPPNVMNPATFADWGEKLSDLGVKVKVIKGAELQKLNMGGIASVGRAGSVPPRLLMLEWRGQQKTGYDYGFVGKGVTFDTGGLCLKPSAGMLDMKADMGGGAAVLGAMYVLAARKVAKNVVCAIPLAENMISSDAYRPSDILHTHANKSIEVIDTDAEGRLILADAISYVSKKYKPEYLVDLATLTGAVIVALGVGVAGLMSNDDQLADKLDSVGRSIGEKLWRLPLSSDYASGLKSHIADIRNLSKDSGAGTITAGQFLQEFIEPQQKWAHIDIAGVAYRASKSPLHDVSMGTGYGVRLLTGLVVGEELL